MTPFNASPSTTPRRIDDCLHVRDGRLHVEERAASELVAEFGSPLFVISEDQIRRNVRRFQQAFAKGWTDGPVKVLPAAKANWTLAAQRILAQEGCGCDVYSAGELDLALRAGFPPELISANGVPKDESLLRTAVEAGVRITIDSRDEVPKIAALAAEASRPVRVRLRLKPRLSFTRHSEFVAEGLIASDLAALGYKGGLVRDEIRELAPMLKSMKNVELVGFHQHHGRHRSSLKYWEAQMDAFAGEVAAVCDMLGGFAPRELDIGGGFAIPRDPHNAATHYADPFRFAVLHALSRGLSLLGMRRRDRALRPLVDTVVSRPRKRRAPAIEDYADVCTRTLREALQRHGVSTNGVMLQLEPGRAIHGDAGVHLCTVQAKKRLAPPLPWDLVVVDTTEFWMTAGRYEHHLHEYVVADRADRPRVRKVDVVGRSCFGDRVLPTVMLPEVEVGDVLAMLDAGAYQEGSCSNFNALPRPATVLVQGDQAYLARVRETQDDVFRRDRLPSHLQPDRHTEPRVAARPRASASNGRSNGSAAAAARSAGG